MTKRWRLGSEWRNGQEDMKWIINTIFEWIEKKWSDVRWVAIDHTTLSFSSLCIVMSWIINCREQSILLILLFNNFCYTFYLYMRYSLPLTIDNCVFITINHPRSTAMKCLFVCGINHIRMSISSIITTF